MLRGGICLSASNSWLPTAGRIFCLRSVENLKAQNNMPPPDTNPLDKFNLNSPSEDTVLGSRNLNPDYLFENVFGFFRKVFEYLFSPDGRGLLKTLMFMFAIFFLTVIGYSVIRIFEIRRKEEEHLKHELAEYAHKQAEKERAKREGEAAGGRNQPWVGVLQYLFSNNENDWRLALMEADNILDSLLGELGFPGQNLGEKLKSADQSTFRPLSTAWE